MKKIFCAVTMLAAAYTLNAQSPPKDESNSSSNNVPSSIQSDFKVHHPGVMVMTWQPMNDWWYATYKNDDNRMIRVYYHMQTNNSNGNDFIEALPEINTFVPEAVITTAIASYGNDLYSITALKQKDSKDLDYQVCLVKNGVSDRIMMTGGGVPFAKNDKRNSY